MATRDISTGNGGRRLMIRAATVPLSRRIRLEMPWWQIGLYAIANVPIILAVLGGMETDWTTIADAPAAYFRGDLYNPRVVPYAWSPIAALVLAVFVPFGYAVWLGLHVAVLGLLRSPTLILLAMLSGGFWADAIYGNSVTFVFVAGVLALRGSRTAGLVSVVLFVLMPRPLQVPMLAWLLWTSADLRLPTLAIVVVHVLAVAATGYGPEWIGALTSIGGTQIVPQNNWGPTQFIGVAWLVVGIPLAVWLTVKQCVGLAGVAMSPYILPQYSLIVLWDLSQRGSFRSIARPGPTDVRQAREIVRGVVVAD